MNVNLPDIGARVISNGHGDFFASNGVHPINDNDQCGIHFDNGIIEQFIIFCMTFTFEFE